MFAQTRMLRRLFSLFLVVDACLIFFSPSSQATEIEELEGELRSRATPPGSYRASEIIDHPVENDRSEELGEIDNLIIQRNGKVKKAILSVGPFLGEGERFVAVPFSSLKIHERGKILYRVTREQLERHPAYSYPKEHPYGFCYSPYPPLGSSHSVYPPGRERYYPYPMGWVPFSPGRTTVSSLLGLKLINTQGEPVGKVNDFIIHIEEGNIEKIIISVNGLIKEKRVALPFKPLELSVWGIYYDITKRQIDLLPEFKYPEYEKK